MGNHIKLSQVIDKTLIKQSGVNYHIAAQRGNISRMPSGAIIHDENFYKCMALNNIATPNSANFDREKFHKLSSISEICEKFLPRK